MANEGNENALIQMGGGKSIKNRVRKIMKRTEKPSIQTVEKTDEQRFTNEEIDYFYYVEGMNTDALKENPHKVK